MNSLYERIHIIIDKANEKRKIAFLRGKSLRGTHPLNFQPDKVQLSHVRARTYTVHVRRWFNDKNVEWEFRI